MFEEILKNILKYHKLGINCLMWTIPLKEVDRALVLVAQLTSWSFETTYIVDSENEEIVIEISWSPGHPLKEIYENNMVKFS